MASVSGDIESTLANGALADRTLIPNLVATVPETLTAVGAIGRRRVRIPARQYIVAKIEMTLTRKVNRFESRDSGQKGGNVMMQPHLAQAEDNHEHRKEENTF